MKGIEWFGVIVLAFMALAPFIYFFGGLGSLSKDAITERKIRKLFREYKVGEALERFEQLIGSTDMDVDLLSEMVRLSQYHATSKQLADHAVAYWKRKQGPRLYDT